MVYLVSICSNMKKCLTEETMKSLMSDPHSIAELEREWEQLTSDRNILRTIFDKGDNKVIPFY